MDQRHRDWKGSKWIRKERRLGIYLRDGLACVWCGATVEDGSQLSLDHIVPASRNGGHESANLATACSKCNTARGNRSVTEFAKVVADYLNHDATAEEIARHVKNCTRRTVKLAEAKRLIARRGSISRVLNPE